MFNWNLLLKCSLSHFIQTSVNNPTHTAVSEKVYQPTCSSDSCDGASETGCVASCVNSYITSTSCAFYNDEDKQRYS